MLGSLDLRHREVTIVGAGIAGMLLAERLDRAGWQVTLLESSQRVGGLIRTDETQWGISEAAAHSFLATSAVLKLCAELGVDLEPVRAGSRARYIWRGGRLRKFPLSLWEVLWTVGRAYFVLADPGRDPSRQTLEQWGRRHLGDAALKYLITPFVRGIYGCRPAELQLDLAFPALIVPHGHSLLSALLRRWHRRLRGLDPVKPNLGGRSRMMAPRGGMGALTQALESRLRTRLGQRFRLGTPVADLPKGAKNLVLCVPASAAARLLAQADPSLSAALAQVRYTPLVTITAFVEKRAFPLVPRGVGVLLPEGTSRRSLGVLFNSSSFPARVRDECWVSMTLMMGGTSRPELAAASISDEELRSHARTDLEALFDLAPGARLETLIRRWPNAVPQYNDLLAAAWDSARTGWCSAPGRLLFGNYTGQVSIRGMIEIVDRILL